MDAIVGFDMIAAKAIEALHTDHYSIRMILNIGKEILVM